MSATPVIAILALLATCLGLERLIALRRSMRPLLGRLLVNFGISALALTAAGFVVVPAARAALGDVADRAFGILHLAPMAPPVRFGLAIVLMDLTFYWWHRANHGSAFLWRFHNVHHIDPDLDASTAFRFHVGEVLLSTGFRVLQIVVIGPTALEFAVYEVIFQANTVFHHSNLRLPLRLERGLNALLVTPRMHGIHHSQVKEETNSNYSVVFSWWDRLHRTVVLDIPQADLVIGVPAYSMAADNSLWSSLASPFRRQRDYWRRPDGTTVRRERRAVSAKRSQLAE